MTPKPAPRARTLSPIPDSVTRGSEYDLSDLATMSEREFAAQVRALGGIPQALAAGLDPWQLPDGDVRSVWLELQRCWDTMRDLTEEAADALTRAEHQGSAVRPARPGRS